jgi:hypothetical protein
MKNLITSLVGIVIAAHLVLGGLANSAVAQEKAAKGGVTPKILLDNAKVKVAEATYKPGEGSASPVSSAFRVVRAVKGGTIERTDADGTKRTVIRKTGEVYMLEPGPSFTFKNIGKTVIQLYVVELK